MQRTPLAAPTCSAVVATGSHSFMGAHGRCPMDLPFPWALSPQGAPVTSIVRSAHAVPSRRTATQNVVSFLSPCRLSRCRSFRCASGCRQDLGCVTRAEYATALLQKGTQHIVGRLPKQAGGLVAVAAGPVQHCPLREHRCCVKQRCKLCTLGSLPRTDVHAFRMHACMHACSPCLRSRLPSSCRPSCLPAPEGLACHSDSVPSTIKHIRSVEADATAATERMEQLYDHDNPTQPPQRCSPRSKVRAAQYTLHRGASLSSATALRAPPSPRIPGCNTECSQSSGAQRAEVRGHKTPAVTLEGTHSRKA